MSQLPTEFILIFLGMVFVAVFLLSQGLTVPVFGEAGRVRKRIRMRVLHAALSAERVGAGQSERARVGRREDLKGACDVIYQRADDEGARRADVEPLAVHAEPLAREARDDRPVH